MDQIKWRFAPSNHGEITGPTTGDSETFKKNPFGNFGREIVQNSIDACNNDDEPATIEFKLFNLNPTSIPGCEDYKAAVRRCMEYWKDSQPVYRDEYQKILEYLQHNSIECLRISDFNTTGLKGVSRPNDSFGNNFLSLTRSTGVSDKKSKNAGGSKGVGKNAAFLLSKLKMVFYSTITTDKEIGYSGVADLITGYCDDNKEDPNRDYTQGKGFFTKDDLNTPINGQLNLDPSFSRDGGETGTDIYIIGLNKESDWSIELLNSILESFLVSIIKNKLVLKISGKTIDKSTVEDIIKDNTFIPNKNKAYLLSQFDILAGKGNVKTFDVNTDFGKADLLILSLKDSEKWLATHKCAIIRYPFMKIFDYLLPKNFNVSAVLIIGEDNLGQKLRSIENPQHNSWEPKRIEQPERGDIQKAINNIKEQIDNDVLECFKTEDTSTIDPYGAGEFLSEIDDSEKDGENGAKQLSQETVANSEFKDATVIEKNANKQDETGEGVQPDFGTSEEEGDDSLHPTGNNNGSLGEYLPGDEASGTKEGDDIIMKKALLSGIRYRIICLNKDKGKYRIVFVSPANYQDCYLVVNIIEDEVTNKEVVAILDMTLNGVKVSSLNDQEYGPFNITSGEKVTIDIATNQTDYFASEVKIYANEK
jgi:hypothetical protein